MRNPAIRKLRALRIIEQRILGQSLAAIGASLDIERDTVMAELSWAKRQGLMETLENRILDELGPASIDAMKKAITNGNTDLALRVFEGTGLFRKTADRQPLLPGATEGEESLEVHVKRINRPSPQEIAPSREASAQLGSVRESPALGPAPLEAELVEDRGQAGQADADERVDLTDYVAQRTAESKLTPQRNEVGQAS